MHRNQECFEVSRPVFLDYGYEALFLLFGQIADDLVVFCLLLDSGCGIQGNLFIDHAEAKNQRECCLIAVAGYWRPLSFVHLVKQPSLDLPLLDGPRNTH